MYNKTSIKRILKNKKMSFPVGLLSCVIILGYGSHILQVNNL